MADLRNIKHLFFDLDDTLWDFERNSQTVLAELFLQFGLGQKLKTDFDQFHTFYRDVNLALWSKYYKREIDKHEMRLQRFRIVFDNFGYRNEDDNLHLTRLYSELAPRGTHLKEGCRETLSCLAERYKLHIITNGFKDIQYVKIDAGGIRDFFQNIIVSDEHDLVKPEERIFRLAEELAGCTREEAAMIGDSYESDICGALNAGWKAIHFNPRNTPSVHEGLTITRLQDLPRLLGCVSPA